MNNTFIKQCEFKKAKKEKEKESVKFVFSSYFTVFANVLEM